MNADIYVTWDCNYNCSHCMAADVRGPVYMPKSMFQGVIDELVARTQRSHSCNGTEVHLSGGEPFLHPDIFSMLEYAANKPGFRVNVNTNGSMIPVDAPKSFFDALPENVILYLSVDPYHTAQDPYLEERIGVLKRFRPDGYRLNIRTSDEKEHQDAHQELDTEEDPSIGSINRVLAIGSAKYWPDARRIDLTKLLNDSSQPDSNTGILPDGTVVTNFIAAYLPPHARPQICKLGNLNTDSLDACINRGSTVSSMRGNSEVTTYLGFFQFAIRSMMEDMRDYPYVVSAPPNNFSWAYSNLKAGRDMFQRVKEILGIKRENIPERPLDDVIEEVTLNTARAIGAHLLHRSVGIDHINYGENLSGYFVSDGEGKRLDISIGDPAKSAAHPLSNLRNIEFWIGLYHPLWIDLPLFWRTLREELGIPKKQPLFRISIGPLLIKFGSVGPQHDYDAIDEHMLELQRQLQEAKH